MPRTKKTTKKTTPKRARSKKAEKKITLLDRIAPYFTTNRRIILMMSVIFVLGIVVGSLCTRLILNNTSSGQEVLAVQEEQNEAYWFVLLRRSNVEKLYYGIPGDESRSELVKIFNVKTGIPGERPTPLPELAGREYWLITKKYPQDNPETAPYFLELDVPGVEQEPYGPTPYNECNGQQCNWILPGAFGLHGVNGDPTRLSFDNPGSSGCIRHSDEDITFLYNLINPEEEVRYYVKSI